MHKSYEQAVLDETVRKLMRDADRVEHAGIEHAFSQEIVCAMRAAATAIAAIGEDGVDRSIPGKWLDRHGNFLPGFEYLDSDPGKALPHNDPLA